MKMFVIYLMLVLSIPAVSQHIIKGRITDKTDNEPLQYAIVSVGIKGRAIMTDKEGYFQLNLPKKENTIYVSLVGYEGRSVDVSSTSNLLVIALERGAIDLKEITITPQSNNASFQTISGIDLNLRPVNSSQDLLRLVPGLFLGEHHGGGIAEHIFSAVLTPIMEQM